MTTATQRDPRNHGFGILLGAAGVAVAVGAVVTGLGALIGGSSAAYGALVGSAIAVLVFGFGAFSINAVATVSPTTTLLVALVTYTVQVVVMFLVLLGFGRSGLLEETLDRGWLAAGMLATSVVWLIGQLLLATRARIPAYDVELPGDRPEAEPNTR